MWREALKQLASDIDPILDFPLDLAATTWFAVESRARRLGRRVTRIPDANLDWPTALKVLLSASGDDVEGCLLGLLAALDAAAESKHIVDGRVRTCTVHLDGATARVQMWFKPPSMLGRWRRGHWDLAQQAGVRPMRYPDLVTEQLQHLGFAAVRHLSTQIEPRLSDLQTGRSLAIALCPLLTGCHTHFVAKDAGPEGVFWARPSAPLSAPARLAQHLEAMGEWLAAEGAHVAVLPELSIPRDWQPVLDGWFDVPGSQLEFIVGGSFHQLHGARRYNRLTVLGRRGALWHHDKSGAFRILRRQVDALDWFELEPGTRADSFEEAITRGASVVCADTPIGRLASVICADVLEPGQVRSALLGLRPDLVLIASMSPKTERFHRFAEDLADAHGATVFVNAASVVRGHADRSAAEQADLGFVCLPWPDRRDQPAARLRWTVAGDVLERRGSSHVWRPARGDRLTVHEALGAALIRLRV